MNWSKIKIGREKKNIEIVLICSVQIQ